MYMYMNIFHNLQINTPSNLPSSANVVLPPIHVHGDYKDSSETGHRLETLAEGLTLREGPYLNAAAEVGAFEHSLTTDLLNHLVFVQKVFMKVRLRDDSHIHIHTLRGEMQNTSGLWTPIQIGFVHPKWRAVVISILLELTLKDEFW